MSITLDRSAFVPVAEVARAHGIRGELRLKVYNPETDLFATGRRVVLRGRCAKPGDDRTVRILAARAIPQGVLVKLEGISDRDQAERLAGHTVLVPRADLPALEAGEFYAFDLEGARVELVTGELVGKVVRLATYPTCEVLVVEGPAGESLEFPLVDDVVDEIDSARGLVKLKSRESL